MSDKEVETGAKKRRSPFWYVVIGCVVLVIAYQSGRSSGIRSAMDSNDRPVAAPQTRSAGESTPTYRQQSLAAQSGAQRVVNYPAATMPEVPRVSPDRPANSRPVERAAAPQNRPAPPDRPAASPPTGPPPGLVPSVVVPADPSQVPHPAPVNSIYDRRSPGVFQAGLGTSGAVRASQVGMLPLEPLRPLEPSHPGLVGTMSQSPSPDLRIVPVVPASPIVVCDCGVVH